MSHPLEELLEATVRQTSASREGDSPMGQLHAEAQAAALTELRETFDTTYVFSPGDLIQFKPNMRNKRAPRYGQPAIVQKVLEESELYPATEDPGSSYATERLDLIVGLLDSDGDYLLFYADSRRFEPFRRPASHGVSP